MSQVECEVSIAAVAGSQFLGKRDVTVDKNE
ncbi:MAG: hypothetical protein XD81_1501 [Bacteroidetes bacterium 38_7]|nr:MAG: hypothetical protein XD81_1501 [Bacteroidetes bacterium 38_7]